MRPAQLFAFQPLEGTQAEDQHGERQLSKSAFLPTHHSCRKWEALPEKQPLLLQLLRWQKMFLLKKNQEWCDNVLWSKSSRQIRLVDWGWQSTVSGNQPEPLAFLEGACGNLKVRQLTKIRILSRLLGQTIGKATTHKPKQFSLERYLNNSGRERGTAHSYCQCSHSTAKIQVRLNCTTDNLYCPKTAGWIKEQKNNFHSPKQKIYFLATHYQINELKDGVSNRVQEQRAGKNPALSFPAAYVRLTEGLTSIVGNAPLESFVFIFD